MICPSPGLAIDAALERAEWQPLLFCAEPRRRSLLALKPTWQCRHLHINVHRNETFEHIASVMPPFLGFAGYTATFHYGGYDDAVAFAGMQRHADVEFIWLDFDRYSETEPSKLSEWLVGRVASLRRLTDAPILIANWDRDDSSARQFNGRLVAAEHLRDVLVVDRLKIAKLLGPRYRDERSTWTGSRLSGIATILAARELAFTSCPAAIMPRLKAVAADLDRTLYQGVLGEDGAHGIVLTEAHARVQERLRALRESGIFLALVSRNEPEDVVSLFAQRPDFPLRFDDFSAVAVGWSNKGSSVSRIANDLRIATSSILFLDDNAGELAAVVGHCRGVHTAHAEDPDLTLSILDLYPGLAARSINETDRVRVADLGAMADREALAVTALSPEQYLRELQVRLTIDTNPRQQLARLADLSRKTNQFNLSLNRLDEVALDRRIESVGYHIVSVALRDRLADSGIIGLLVCRRENHELVVEELCVSCRALGRQLEDMIVFGAIRPILARSRSTAVVFPYRTGPRNTPALDWLCRASGEVRLGDEGAVAIPLSTILDEPQNNCVQIQIEGANDA